MSSLGEILLLCAFYDHDRPHPLPCPRPAPCPTVRADPESGAASRGVFAAQIDDDGARSLCQCRAPLRPVVQGPRAGQLVDVQPFRVAAFVKSYRSVGAPTVKQHLAAMRMLFDWW